MTRPVVVIGGGGMGRCVLDVIDAVNSATLPTGDRFFELVGVLDDGDPDVDLLAARGVRFLGPLWRIEEIASDVGYLIGIGSTTTKRKIDDVLVKSGRPSPVLIHPNVHRGFDVQLGPGTIVCSHVSMESHVRLGRHVHVNQNSTIGHDTVIGDHSTVSPLVAVSGNVTMQDAVFIGAGSAILPGVKLDAESTVGMGAAVVRDVASQTTVLGVPAQPRS